MRAEWGRDETVAEHAAAGGAVSEMLLRELKLVLDERQAPLAVSGSAAGTLLPAGQRLAGASCTAR